MYQVSSKIDKEVGSMIMLKPYNCFCRASAISTSSDPEIKEVPFTYHNCVAELIIILISVLTSFPLFMLLIRHVRQKTRTVSRTLKGTQFESAEDSIKCLQVHHNYLGEAVGGNHVSFQGRNSKDRQLILKMARRKILWRLTLSGIFRSKKFYILVAGLALNMCCFVHWTYEIESPYQRQQLSMIELFLRFVGVYTVIYFVFRKASKQLIDNKMWVRGLIPTFILSFLLMLTLMIFLQLQFWSLNDHSKSVESREASLKHVSCSSPIWVVSSLFDFTIILLFYKFVKQLDIATKKHIQEEKDIYGFKDDNFLGLYHRMRNLWLIIKVYCAMSFYLLVFSVISFFWAQHIKSCALEDHRTHHKYIKCNVITMVPMIDTWLWLLSRVFSYFLWQLPLIYIFWQR